MKIIESPLQRKLQLWTMIGPLCLIFTLATSVLKKTVNPVYLPYAILFGLVVCWRWQMKGFVLTALLFLTMALYRLVGFPFQDPIWEGGLMVAALLGCLTTALSFEEAKDLIIQEWSRPSNEIEELHDELKALQEKWEDTSCLLAKEIDEKLLLQQEKDKIEASRKELENSYSTIYNRFREFENESAVEREMLKESFRQEINLLQQKLSQNENTRLKITDDKKLLEVKHKEAANHFLKIEAEFQKLKSVNDDLAMQLIEKKEEVEKLGEKLPGLEVENIRLRKELEAIQAKAEQPAKLDHWEEFRQAQGLYLQLKEQFEEKSKELDKARKELFQVSEELEALKKDQEEKYFFERSDLERQMEKYLEELDQRYHIQLKELQKEIDMLQDIITYQSAPN